MAGSDLKRLVPAMEQLANRFSFEWIDAEIVKEGTNRYLRIYIDKPGGITLDDCEIYHRAVSALVEAVDYDFLEVCSPGLDRPLKTDRDFERHTGETVEVHLYKPVNGQKVYEGVLQGRWDGVLTVECGGIPVSFEMKDVSVCRLAVRLEDADFELQETEDAEE